MSQTEPTTPARRLLSTEDAANYIDDLFGLDITQRWLERQMRERRIAYFKIGGMVRFSTDDLDKLLDNARVEATNPLNRISLDDEEDPTEPDVEEEVIEDEEPEPEPTPAPKPKAKPTPSPSHPDT